MNNYAILDYKSTCIIYLWQNNSFYFGIFFKKMYYTILQNIRICIMLGTYNDVNRFDV